MLKSEDVDEIISEMYFNSSEMVVLEKIELLYANGRDAI
jgi:hypothetical protein